MEYTWLIYALLSAVFAALVAVFGKIGLEQIDSTTATAVRALIMAVFLIGVVAFQHKWTEISSIITNHKALTFIALSGVAGALSWLFYFFALRNGNVYQVVPIDRLSVVFALVFSFFFLSEKVSTKTVLGAALIVAGGILIALS